MGSGSTGNARTRYAARTKKRLGARTRILAGVAGGVAVLLVVFLLLPRPEQSRQQLDVGLLLEPTNLDIRNTSGVSLEQILLDNVYEGLITLAPNSVRDYEPRLAKKMPTVSADNRIYTFTLREDIYFHSGSKLTTADVVHSLKQGITAELLKVQTVTVSSPQKNTVEISLSEPNSMLLWHLANRAGVILEKKHTGSLRAKANGTGPFKVAKWQRGHSLRLETNDNYWSSKPALKTVLFHFITDSAAAVNALETGTLDVYTALQPALQKSILGNPDFKMSKAPSTDVFTLAFNSAKEPFNNPQVRRALSMAIDSKRILAAINGDGKALGAPITELEPGYRDFTSFNSYDPQRAKKLLQDAGVTDLQLTITAPNFYDPVPLEIVVSQLANVGVKATVKRVEFSTWLEQVYTQKNYDLSYVDHAEAHDFGNYANPDYYFGYQNKDVTNLYQQALLSGDKQQRQQLLAHAAQLVAVDAPAKWLYNYTPALVIRTSVADFPLSNTNARLPLAQVSIR